MSNITQELVRNLFMYRDGNLVRITARCGIRIGDTAGSLNATGYHEIKIDNKVYKTHRLIFLYHHGYLPEFLDHIDGNRSNNKIDNLRPCTLSENAHNSKINKNSKSGIKGVTWHTKNEVWRADIRINDKLKYLGCFPNMSYAADAVRSAREFYHGDFANHG